jgi:hypothetical protein
VIGAIYLLRMLYFESVVGQSFPRRIERVGEKKMSWSKLGTSSVLKAGSVSVGERYVRV